MAEVEWSIARFGDHYLRRIYTADELASCATGRRLAACFAAKEATLKVLAPDDADAIDWRCIDAHGLLGTDPLVALSGAAAELASRRGIVRVSGSVDAGRTRATAVVLAESRSG